MNEVIDWKTEVLPILEEISDKGANINIMRKLFIEKLNYEFADQELHIEYPESIKEKVLSTDIISEKNEFKVIFCKIKTLLTGIELPVVKSITRYWPANIIIFTNEECDEAHFINTKYVGKERDKKVKGFRRITVGKTDRLRTAAERLSKIYADVGVSVSALMTKCEEAFDVEAVSEEFYEEFVKKYKELRNTIFKKNKVTSETSDKLTQEIFNRLLFLYFIQKKKWLNDDDRFLYNNFKKFKRENKEYYKNFLVPLFKKLSIRNFKYQGFENIPFLNGGLFEFQKIEEKISIPNEFFEDIFDDLLERFNFTIREDTEFEEEVAIDPEMLGKIFEELILSVESEKYRDIPDPRRASGSYYTPRFIVSFMVKQSLLNYLIKELPEIPKEKLKALIFKLDEEESISDIENPEAIKEKLLNLRIVDPGVGSGAFAVDILNKMVHLIEILNQKLNQHEDRFNLRKKLIEDCIYGVDIQERAVHLARLRLWLSLIVDLETKEVKDIPPLINLDFKIIKGDSLVSKICGFKFDLKTITSADQRILELIEKFKKLKDKYSETVVDAQKQDLKEKIRKTKSDIAIWWLENIKKSHKEELKRVGAQLTLIEKTQKEIRDEEQQKEKIKHEISAIDNKIEKIKSSQDIDAFNWHLDFFEVIGVKEGFDIVIANPPYGVDVDKDVYEDEFGLGSKDSYGVFTALGVNILKPGGTLCYIMSDTGQTIRTHYKLRKKLFEETEAQYLISVPMRTFKATVNTGIYLFRKSAIDKEKDNFIIAADFHNLDIKKGDLEVAFDLITDIEPDEKCQDGYTIISDREMAIYVYRQKIIRNFSNLSFFIASPKLFKLMQDVGNIKPKVFTNEKGEPVMFDVGKQKNLFEQEGPDVYEVNFNEKTLELVKLGDVYSGAGKTKNWSGVGLFKIISGIKTGNNQKYLRCIRNCQKNLEIINTEKVLTLQEIKAISEDEKRNGIKSKIKCYVPFEMGMPSEIEEGILPQYFQRDSNIVINWSKKAVISMKKEPHSDLANEEFRFIDFENNISISMTGQYAPTFRISVAPVFVNASSRIISYSKNDLLCLLGILNSKLTKYLLKSFINHSVGVEVDDFKKYNFVKNFYDKKILKSVDTIIQKQKQNPRYDYMTNEQIEIDKLVYEMYNLNEEDIQEVENWYFRRYPKLASVIEEKLNRKNNGKK
jgi:methylase of polypeptide subunit release factors